jgi:hypothetical protein
VYRAFSATTTTQKTKARTAKKRRKDVFTTPQDAFIKLLLTCNVYLAVLLLYVRGMMSPSQSDWER